MTTTAEQLQASVTGIAETLAFIATNEGQEWDDIDPDDIPAGVDREDVEGDNEGEPLNLLDYVCSQLDATVHGKRVDGEWEVTHVVILFTCGGPHIEYTTETNEVSGRWGSDSAAAYVGSDVDRYIDEAFES